MATIIIRTSEEAQAMMDILDREKIAARKNDYHRERARPVRWMTCTCCGESYQGRQWWNMDTGHGLGDCCVDYCRVDRTPGVENESYGVAGIHFVMG